MKSIRLKMIAKMHFRDTRINFPETVEKLYNPLWANLQVNISRNLANKLIFKNILEVYEK
jgi:hypothetical protein